MPQTPERKREYARERLARDGERIRSKGAEWRAKNRAHLMEKSRLRRLNQRAMCLVAAARIRARKKGIAFSLSSEETDRLQAVIDRGVCELSGVPFTLEGSRSATSPSLDRIIPYLGYIDGNVRVICHALNAGMGDWGEQELRRIVETWLGNAIVPPLAAEFIRAALS